MNEGDRATAGGRRENASFLAGNETYVRDVMMEGTVVYGIHAPDGRLLAVAPTRDLAFAVARQNRLDPLSVH